MVSGNMGTSWVGVLEAVFPHFALSLFPRHVSLLNDKSRIADFEYEYRIFLGNLFPWVDTLWEGTNREAENNGIADLKSKDPPGHASIDSDEEERRASRDGNDGGADLTHIIRIIGVFIGIAFAIVSGYSEIETCHAKLTFASSGDFHGNRLCRFHLRWHS